MTSREWLLQCSNRDVHGQNKFRGPLLLDIPVFSLTLSNISESYENLVAFDVPLLGNTLANARNAIWNHFYNHYTAF